jgi:hypothetical protein
MPTPFLFLGKTKSNRAHIKGSAYGAEGLFEVDLDKNIRRIDPKCKWQVVVDVYCTLDSAYTQDILIQFMDGTMRVLTVPKAQFYAAQKVFGMRGISMSTCALKRKTKADILFNGSELQFYTEGEDGRINNVFTVSPNLLRNSPPEIVIAKQDSLPSNEDTTDSFKSKEDASTVSEKETSSLALPILGAIGMIGGLLCLDRNPRASASPVRISGKLLSELEEPSDVESLPSPHNVKRTLV